MRRTPPLPPGSDLTGEVRHIVVANPNMLIPHYLIHSYLYYVLDMAVISDCFYEDLCKMLAEKWPEVEHRHKHLIDRQSLSAGTGYYLKEDSYPGIVKGAAKMMVHDMNLKHRKGRKRANRRT